MAKKKIKIYETVFDRYVRLLMYFQEFHSLSCRNDTAVEIIQKYIIEGLAEIDKKILEKDFEQFRKQSSALIKKMRRLCDNFIMIKGHEEAIRKMCVGINIVSKYSISDEVNAFKNFLVKMQNIINNNTGSKALILKLLLQESKSRMRIIDALKTINDDEEAISVQEVECKREDELEKEKTNEDAAKKVVEEKQVINSGVGRTNWRSCHI